MSNSIIPDAAKINVANCIYTPQFGYIKLFKNNATITHATVKADLTEANFTGYAAASLSGATVSGALDASMRAWIYWTAVLWTLTGGSAQNIYGYWVEDASNNLLFVEKFDLLVALSLTNPYLALVPKFTLASQYLNT